MKPRYRSHCPPLPEACSSSATTCQHWVPRRSVLALVKNADLLDMVRLGHASTPLDLLSYPHQKTNSLASFCSRRTSPARRC